MKVYGGMELLRHLFLTLALGARQRSDSRPGRFTPGKRAPSTK